jgi:hypothetical protein
MEEETFSKMEQLKREEAALQRLLDGKLSEMTRPRLVELLKLVQAEISLEPEPDKASGQAA